MAKNQSLEGRISCEDGSKEKKKCWKKRQISYFLQKVTSKIRTKVVTQKKYVGITFMAISIAANRFRLIKQSTAIDGKIHSPIQRQSRFVTGKRSNEIAKMSSHYFIIAGFVCF